jgi:hypothetical protein
LVGPLSINKTQSPGASPGFFLCFCERTEAVLAAVKTRGVKLGNRNRARALRGKQVGNKQAVEKVKANAHKGASNLRTIVDEMRSQGITSISSVAAELNFRGILRPRGGSRPPTSAARLLARFGL